MHNGLTHLFTRRLVTSKWNSGPVDESWLFITLSTKLLIVVSSDQYADDQPFVVY